MSESILFKWDSSRSYLLFILLSISVGLSAQDATNSFVVDRAKNEHLLVEPSHWGIKTAVGLGWPATLELLDQSTSDLASIGLLGLQYRGAISHQWAFALTGELMLIQRSGSLAGRAYRIRNLSAGVEGTLIYQLPNPRWHLHAGMLLRTHRPVSAVDIKRRDNFRFEQRIMGSYQLVRQIHLTSTIGRSLRSRDDSAYLTDPQLQILAGLLWIL